MIFGAVAMLITLPALSAAESGVRSAFSGRRPDVETPRDGAEGVAPTVSQQPELQAPPAEISTTTAPATAPTTVPTATSPPWSAPPERTVGAFKNCDAARAAGAAPVYRGDPGYGRHLDRDNDGIGCE